MDGGPEVPLVRGIDEDPPVARCLGPDAPRLAAALERHGIDASAVDAGGVRGVGGATGGDEDGGEDGRAGGDAATGEPPQADDAEGDTVRNGIAAAVADRAVDCVVDARPSADAVSAFEVLRDVSDAWYVRYADAVPADLLDCEAADYVPREADTGAADLLAARVRQCARSRRRRADLSLRRRAMDQAGVGITIADADHPDMALVYANRGFERLTGYDRAAVVGHNCRFLQGPDTDPETVAELRAAIEAQEPVSVDILNYREDGTPFWNQLDIAPVRDDDGAVTHFFGFQRDITARRRLEDRLRTQNAHLEEFADIISHDLRNPLSVAVAYLEQLRDDAGAADERALDGIETALGRMDELIEDVLTLAREGSGVGETAPTSLSAVARDAWGTVDAPDATLDCEAAAGVTVDADDGRLRTLLENLFRNAAQHGGPDVRVTVEPVDGGFAVADDGPGIPPDEREQVLEKGYSTEREGTGFGLAIVRRIAEAHGWTVAVGESDDGGARFVFEGVDRTAEDDGAANAAPDGAPGTGENGETDATDVD